MPWLRVRNDSNLGSVSEATSRRGAVFRVTGNRNGRFTRDISGTCVKMVSESGYPLAQDARIVNEQSDMVL